jgi:5-methylcytosine-specific restriction endonuclease McrA
MARRKRNRLLKTRCWYCGKQLTRRTRTRDHVVPRACGGLTEFGNIVPACVECNQLKAALLLDAFRLMWWCMTGQALFYGEALSKT